MGQTRIDLRAKKGSPEFRAWLLAELARREWTQADLVRRTGTDAGVVSRWMRLERRPSPESLERLAGVLGADYDALLAMNGYREAAPGEDDERTAALIAKLRQASLTPERYKILEGILEDMRRRPSEEGSLADAKSG